MGAGPLPVGHPPRPPIPIVALDGAAMAAARARRPGDELAAWLAGVTGGDPPVLRTEVVVAEAAPGGAGAELRVGEVAAGVDRGRALAARAAAGGATVLAGGGSGDLAAARAVAAALAAADARPLRTLRRHGDAELCVLCGLALGAGEHGLGYVCDGQAAAVGAAVAAGIEADVRARLLVARRRGEPRSASVLGLDSLPDLDTALALLRRAAAP